MLQARTLLNPRTWYPFNQSNLGLVPEESGVYWLGVDNAIIYIGSAIDLRQRLTDHYHTSDPCISRARQFAIEPCSNYRERERQLLQAYRNEHGRLPECNDYLP